MAITTKKITALEFGILSPSIIRKMAVLKVTRQMLYDLDGYAVKGGLMDQLLGVIDPGVLCKTCYMDAENCPGHFGYIELVRPVIHPHYAKEIYKLLGLTCSSCKKLMLTEPEKDVLKKKVERIKIRGKYGTWTIIKNLLKTQINKCPHCGAAQEKIVLNPPTSFLKGDQPLTPIDVREWLEKLEKADVEFLGFGEENRPEWMVLTILPVPPIRDRPSITLETGERAEDDLTHKLGEIVRFNLRLAENIEYGAPEVIIEDLWELLQYHVTTLIDNETPRIPPARHKSGRPLKTFAQRLKGKEGRFRWTLVGKRTNHSARTVISPDPQINIEEVGVPLEVATTITFPEKVTEFNKEWLKKLVENRNIYPGAENVIFTDGRKKKITEDNKKEIIEALDVGCTVERHLIDGDISLFNRQPTLHRMGIMAHKVRVLPGRTFRLNLAVTKAYNADFDGDEMNFHLPQTEEARTEALEIMYVPNHIKSPRSNSPIISIKHGQITGLNLLTREGTFFSREEAQDILSEAKIDIDTIKNIKDCTGRELASCILPKTFNYEGLVKDGCIQIEFTSSKFNKILNKLIEEQGNLYSLNFINKISRISMAYISKRGFSVSMEDPDIPDAVKKSIKSILEEAKKESEKTFNEYNSGKGERLPGRTFIESREIQVLGMLNRVRDSVGKEIFKNLTETPTILMARVGARGNVSAIAQISGCIGQQVVEMGKRPNKGYNHRVIPHFEKDNAKPEANGFINNNYRVGITPVEYFFHGMSGRVALVDKSRQTPTSGYLYRRLANALQDIKVEYDKTVRDSNNTIIQFKYGEDGLDPSK